jgi:hypothetical protein
MSGTYPCSEYPSLFPANLTRIKVSLFCKCTVTDTILSQHPIVVSDVRCAAINLRAHTNVGAHSTVEHVISQRYDAFVGR